MMQHGLLFVLSGPSGTGKTTLVKTLTERYPHITCSLSATTRPPRPQEQRGIDYEFVSEETFEQELAHHAFLEHAQIFGYRYGTRRKTVEQALRDHHIFLVIDTQGAEQVRKKTEVEKNFFPIFIFVHPPTDEILKKRLKGRKTDDPKEIAERLAWAKVEQTRASQYDYQIVNDQLDSAVATLHSIVVAEEHKTHKHSRKK